MCEGEKRIAARKKSLFQNSQKVNDSFQSSQNDSTTVGGRASKNRSFQNCSINEEKEVFSLSANKRKKYKLKLVCGSKAFKEDSMDLS